MELPWLGGAPLFSSGSEALAALVRWGADRRGWRRVWLPSYYCPEVPAALRTLAGGVEVRTFPDHDLLAPPSPDLPGAQPGDVVVVANQLGIRPRPRPDWPALDCVVLVEDHSHDLASDWALTSRADYAFASLRKTLPLPDGGAVWSPRGLELPPEPPRSDDDERLADRLASALAGRALGDLAEADEPPRFRALARSAAANPGSRPGISPVSRALLPTMPVRAWHERRRRNLALLADTVGTPRNGRILVAPDGGVAFALTLVFDTEAARREAEEALIARAVVPTILWPLDPARDPGVDAVDANLSRRILSIHGDQRFDEADVRRLAAILREALHR